MLSRQSNSFNFKAEEGNQRHGRIRAGRLACVPPVHPLAIHSVQVCASFFDKAFLKTFQDKHQIKISTSEEEDAFILLKKDPMITNFISSLSAYYNDEGKIDEKFSNIKREELLLILLQKQPEFYSIFFDFGHPEKINLEEFMNRNYKFNVSIERFAYLTGRSISAFKRDFKDIFHDTPSRWLVRKRLEEAHFLIERKGKKPTDIYIDLGFEDLSHFSFAFKKKYGLVPSLLKNQVLSRG